MNYEIVTLEKSIVAGPKVRTSNSAPDMGQAIGGLWAKFYQGTYEALPGKLDGKSIGLYTNYANDCNDEYDVYVGCRVSGEGSMPVDVSTVEIPAGRYAKFIVKGDVQKDVGAFWAELWTMDLPRAYTADFEEYQPVGDMHNTEIHMYISLKE